MDPKKIEAIVNWPRPTTGKGIQRFMGAANFHREFTHEFARIAAPLDECRNMKNIEWTEDRIAAFEELKTVFQRNILLQHVDWEKKMYLTTDASLFGIGAWIGQLNQDGDLVPIICASKKLNATQQKWPATKRELYGLMWAMNKFRHYLLGRHFIARVDHKPLVAMMKNKSTILTEGWIEQIMQYSFTTEYLPGESNQLADALSRSYEHQIDIKAVSTSKEEGAIWEAELRGLQLLPLKDRQSMIEKCHALGHYGVKMIHDKIIEEGYYWPNMSQEIKHIIRQCQPCLRYNVEREGYHPAKSITAKQTWDHIQIDLIGPLPMSESGCVYIMTIVDVCTGYTVIRSLKNKEMETISKCLWTVFCEYGTPQILQSDNGTEFVNQVMKTLSVIYGIDHRLSTAYHPSANGLVERVNKEVGRALKKYTEGTYAAWDDWLPLVQIGLNEGINQRTGSSAFSLMYGRKFNNFHDFSHVKGGDTADNKAPKDVEKAWKQFREIVLPSLNKKVSEMKNKQEKRLNSQRQIKSLQPGTIVMTVDQTRGSKWDPVYEGPYEIVQQHNGGAYSLKDSLGRIMERRQTIDMMKIVSGPNKIINKKNSEHYSVEQIKQHRRTPNGFEFLVKWKGYSDKDNSWVKAEDFNGQQMIKKYWKTQEKIQKARPLV